MSIYYFMFEAKPLPDSPECESCGGAYITCWVNSEDENRALEEAIINIRDEKWEVIDIEEKFIAHRSLYEHNPESLDCFDQAVNNGISAIFHVWPLDSDNDE